MTTTCLRIALAQYPHDRDPALAVLEAESAGAEIIVFPEMLSNGYAGFDPADPGAAERWRQGAINANGDFIAQFRSFARRQGLYVVATFLEAAEPAPFNAALLIDPQGNTVLHHRKVYICDFDSPEMACGRGTKFAAVEIQARAGSVRLGLMICMDREYPEAARALSGAGAEIALAPNCCFLATDPVAGDVRIAQMRGRAFETVMGIAVANYPAPRCDGHSFAVDPTGAVIAMANSAPGLIVTDFDLSLIRRLRAEEHFRWRLEAVRP